MVIKWYSVREKPLVVNDDGSAERTFNTIVGAVTVFTYSGGEHGRPFTNIECRVKNHVFHATLDHAINPRYLRRTANQFAAELNQSVLPSVGAR